MCSALRKDYGLHSRPIMQAIGKNVKKLEDTGVVINIERPVRNRFARTDENIASKIKVKVLPKTRMCRLFLPAIEEYDLENMVSIRWFQQDSAICHITQSNTALLQETFPGRITSSRGDINWPDFFVGLRERPCLCR